MATYEIQCDNTMDNALFIETSKRKAEARAEEYAARGFIGSAAVHVVRVDAFRTSLCAFYRGTDGKVRRVS